MTIPSWKRPVWLRRPEEWRLQVTGTTPHYRSVRDIVTLLSDADLTATRVEPEATGGEQMWLVAENRIPAAVNPYLSFPT